MLTKKQIKEIREHLEKAQNPVFYYDNDCDGLCSFLLLRRYLGRGKGVAVKSYPDLNIGYARKAQEFKSDYVFVLDKPLISKEFLEEIDKMQLSIVWIDHHNIEQKEMLSHFSNVYFYNPAFNRGRDKSVEPVTYLCYQITERKEDLWLSVIGCIADHYMPSFSQEFAKYYPEYWADVKEPFDAYYKTEIGRIAQALSFGLKDSITHVVGMQNFLVDCRSPGDVFAEIEGNRSFRGKYEEIKKKYDILLAKAKESFFGSLLFFDYAGELSISAELANELSYVYPDKYIAVAYIKGRVSNVSLRGRNVRRILEKVLGGFDESSGGGHENAVGARIRTEDLARFREVLESEVNK